MDFITRGFVSNAGPPSASKSQKDTEAPSGSSTSSSKANGQSEIDIQSVLDVLPHLSVELVRKLLTRYDDTESAIAAVLEGNLPPDLMDTNANDEKIADEPAMKHTELMQQFNSGPDDREIVDVKLKSQVVRRKAERRFLDDKSAIKDFHARNIEHGYVDDDYDDEYDDSYDAVVETESKAMSVLKKTGAIDVLVDEIDDSEESDSNEETANTYDQRDRSRDFCENPELARERWARNRESKYGNKRPQKPSGYSI